MNRSESIGNLGKALAKAQTQLTNVKVDSQNPHFKSKYASLTAVNETVLPILSANGIAVLQGVSSPDVKCVGVSTTFIHGESGEWWTEELFLPPTKVDPQGFGSAITYGRRYLLMAMAGVATDDDDANEASKPQQAQRQPQPPVIAPTLPVPQAEKKEEKQTTPHPAAKVAIKDGSLKTLHGVGTKVYGDGWEAKRHELVASITEGRTNSSSELHEDEAQKLIAGISQKLQKQAA
jgi:hypothetical protein